MVRCCGIGSNGALVLERLELELIGGKVHLRGEGRSGSYWTTQESRRNAVIVFSSSSGRSGSIPRTCSITVGIFRSVGRKPAGLRIGLLAGCCFDSLELLVVSPSFSELFELSWGTFWSMLLHCFVGVEMVESSISLEATRIVTSVQSFYLVESPSRSFTGRVIVLKSGSFGEVGEGIIAFWDSACVVRSVRRMIGRLIRIGRRMLQVRQMWGTRSVGGGIVTRFSSSRSRLFFRR